MLRTLNLETITFAASEALFTFSQLFGDAFFPHVHQSLHYIIDHLTPTPNAEVVCKICEGLRQVQVIPWLYFVLEF